MIIIPLDPTFTFFCVAICAAIEVLRFVLAFMLSRPSPEIKKLQIERTEANIELAGIKSIQLELVRHSLLTRKIIKYDKQIEKLQGEYMPKLKKVRNASRIVRLCFYIPFCLYYYQYNFVVIDPKIFWPVSLFASQKTIEVPVWVFIFSSAFAIRHIIRTIIPLMIRDTEFA